MEKKGQKKQVASKSLKQGTQDSAAHAKEKTVVSRIEEHDIDGTMAGSTGKGGSGHEGTTRPNVSPAVVRQTFALFSLSQRAIGTKCFAHFFRRAV